MYQARKKIVPGRTNALRLLTSSWNSGDRSIASQSMSRSASPCCADASTLSPPSMGCPRGRSTPLCAPFTLLLLRGRVLAARRVDLLRALARAPAPARRRGGAASACLRRASRTAAELGHGTASPVVHAGGSPLGQRPASSSAIAPSQNVCTIGSGDRIGSTISAPQMTPSTPMKRVSSPTRMPLRQITTHARPSASEARPIAWVPGMPISCAATSRLELPMSSARSTVRAPSRKSVISADVPSVNSTVATAPASAAGQREVDPEAAERRAARAHRGAEVGEHQPDRDEAEAARHRGHQHGERAVVVELVVGHAQARERADAAVAPGPRQRVGEARGRRAVEHRRGGDAGADHQQGAERGGDRRPRALPGLPLEGLFGGRGGHRQAVRSGGPPIGVRGPAPIAAAADRGRSGCARRRARRGRRRTGAGRARARRRGSAPRSGGRGRAGLG